MGIILAIKCPTCGARFRFDGQLFKGALRARVRCRQCGGVIEVTNPDVPRHPGPQDLPGPVYARSRRAPVSERPQPAAPPKPGGPSPKIASDLPSPGGGDMAGPGRVPMRPDFEVSVKDREEISSSPPATESRGEADRDYDHLARLKQVREYKERPHDRRLTSLAPFIAVTLGIVLVLGGGLWIIGAPDEIQFAGVEAYYRNNLEAGKLFVLRGRVVVPPALSGKGRIRVHASVLNDKKGVVAERTTPAGVMIPDEVLGYRNRDSIEEALSRAGDPEVLTAAGPTPDGTIPFMVVFFNVNDTVTSYKLSAHREE